MIFRPELEWHKRTWPGAHHLDSFKGHIFYLISPIYKMGLVTLTFLIHQRVMKINELKTVKLSEGLKPLFKYYAWFLNKN